MTARQARPAIYAMAAIYTVVMKLLPYVLMQAGVMLDPESMAYPWNFTPLLAVCLYGGAMLPRRGMSLVLPLVMMFVSDLGVWAISGHRDWAFYPGQIPVYASLIVCSLCGWLLRRNWSWLGTVACAAVTPVLFFLITNFACWVGNDRFPQTVSGLLMCYDVAIPHHKFMQVSTMLFSVLLFSPLGVRTGGDVTPLPAEEPQPLTATM